MNTHRIRFHLIGAVCATACSLSSVVRAAEPRANATQPAAAEPSQASVAPLGGETLSANEEPVRRAAGDMQRTLENYRGKPITGIDRQKLGTVEDFIVDTETGKVVYAVARNDTKEGLRLIQQSSLRAEAEGFTTELDQEAFDGLEALSEEQLEATKVARVPMQSQQLSEAVAPPSAGANPATTPAIGSLPPSADSVSAASTAAAAHPEPVTPATTKPVQVTAASSAGGSTEAPQRATHLVRASELKGTEVRRNSQTLGKIDAIGLDLNEGEAVALVQLAEKGAESAATYLVPFSRLQFEKSGEGLSASTRLTRSDFERAEPAAHVTASRQSRNVEESLSPTGRSPGTPEPRTSNPNTTASSPPASAAGSGSATAGSSDRSGGFNIDRAMSGRGVGGTPPDAPKQRDQVQSKSGNDASTPSASSSQVERVEAAGKGAGQHRAAASGVALEVRAALQSDSMLATQDIEVQEAGRKILLRGTVANPEMKTRAEQVARKAAGALAVDNNLSVQKR